MPRLENKYEHETVPEIVDLARFTVPSTPMPDDLQPDPDAPVPLVEIAPSLDPNDLAALDALCRAKRSVAAQLSPLQKLDEKIKLELRPLAARLSLPRRVLADEWDLRTSPGRETFDVEQAKIEMIKAGLPIDKVNAIVARSTKVGEPSYSVYAPPKKKGGDYSA